MRDVAPDALVVLSADAVYALDDEQVVQGHLTGGALREVVCLRTRTR